MKRKLNLSNIFFKQANIEVGDKAKIKMPGIVLIVILLIAIGGGILLLSSWTCGNFTKKAVKAELKK